MEENNNGCRVIYARAFAPYPATTEKQAAIRNRYYQPGKGLAATVRINTCTPASGRH